MSPSVIIIGGGVAGLAAGCYAQMNGFRTEILEMHTAPGGLCTAWKRKGYTFDGCLHWLVGSSPRSSMHRLWEEVGVIQGRTFITYEYYSQVLDDRGNRLILYTDPGRLREQMVSIAPKDERLINRIIHDIKKLSRRDMPVELGVSGFFGMLPIIIMFMKYRMPAQEIALKFKSPVMRELFASAFGWNDMSFAFMLWTMALMAAGDGGYAIGGSGPLSEAMAARYASLGGTIYFRSRVDRILVKNGHAVGVRLADGTERRADYIISAADGHATIFDMLEERYINKKIRDCYSDLDPFPPLVYVSLGIAADYSGEPHSLSFPLARPFAIGPTEVKRISIRIYNFDPTMAPAGKTTVNVMLETDYDYWKQLCDDRERYRAEKERIGKAVIDGIAELYPALPSQVEVIDVATPLTFERYTGNWRGSYEGWLLNKKALSVRIPQQLPGLSNFFMVGQWVSPGGGLPAGVITARNAIRKLCGLEKRNFVTKRY
ncbi:MAG: hypothetical protein A2176_12425 [Spirochaetes bacterium RBG_13_51_14]|nr:MAG: hypothetical protein A2176_12425 [Spirochaetes bacterium RBG_13_51_14]